uniref:Uncharacterized protein n=1 Tax=Chromera velia CCMP2878 TaxID=1169474 RepID=A0A0G4I3Y5_9ALVE|mmetsp:Transcript_55296/g.108206  ORF Transcript_55296/g.108206 Transcript_55296/m.108206 type:complete len:448 (+) Transcript_55296:190-1533(+)|eukprot:Cvel_35520.t1-p1 / transcript=Cvel_35520.t1 / gene=Cvel_35520 / organism=Chromera_velia_CCMP2878 / gene_product=Putative ankyrin repeat protein RF_0381, putative / transcript_product=Putative ankyrin repeat protein RF_0381, putative / location=Cvel_scaffold6523:422-1762(+) / protein_length=447 / sequence_SO=supercontig / SO=protein_coding / is_pseudo=false
MNKDAQALSAVQRELKVVEASLLGVVGLVQKMQRVLGSVEFSDGDGSESASTSPAENVTLTPPAEEGTATMVPPAAAAVSNLQKSVEEMKKVFHAELNSLMNLFYTIDMGSLREDVFSVVRSFQPVGVQSVHKALEAFLKTGQKREKDDLSVLLKAGAQLDGLIEIQTETGGKRLRTPLIYAVLAGNFQAVNILVKGGAGVMVRDPRGFSALHAASQKGDVQIAKFLLSKGADLTAESETGVRPLALAAYNGARDLVTFFLTKKANLHAKTKDGDTALHLAVSNAKDLTVKTLLDRGAKVNEPNKNGLSPLFYTVVPFNTAPPGPSDHGEIAKLLVSRGARVNARLLTGRTVLLEAAYQGSAEVVSVLLKNGADIHAVDNRGNTALHHAVQMKGMGGSGVELEKRLRIAELLVKGGIDVGYFNNSGRTARENASSRYFQTFFENLPS